MVSDCLFFRAFGSEGAGGFNVRDRLLAKISVPKPISASFKTVTCALNLFEINFQLGYKNPYTVAVRV